MRLPCIYNDEIRNVKKNVIPNVAHDERESIEVGATIQTLIKYEMKNSHYDGGEKSVISQTLFNNDSKWEYIRGTFLLKGMYIYTVLSGGKTINTGKMIVQ